MKLIALPLLCALALPADAGAKLIEYGWDCKDTAYVREHFAEMDRLPFDGMVIKVMPPDKKGSLGWRAFSARRFQPSEYEPAIADLKAARFKRLRHNFIQVISMPGDVDWFDSEWSSVAHNAACLARVAKEGGCAGIMFDPELYGKNPAWNYVNLPEDRKKAHTCEQYVAKARERGREFIRAVNAAYPDLTILALYAYSLPYMQSRTTPLRNTEYALLVPFLDGVIEAATPGTVLVDGYEFSYGYRIREGFVEAREMVLDRAKSISACPGQYAEHVRAGFGIWADFNSGKLGWFPDDLSKNYFTPAGLRASLNYALSESDSYVWVYSERFDWWTGTAPREFVEAPRLARKGPGPGFIPKQPTPHAADQTGYSDAGAFARLGPGLIELFSLPRNGWKFHRDPDRLGERDGYSKPGFNDSAWRAISIGEFWEEQGEEDYDGTAWYRLEFHAPGFDGAGPLYLAFGAADEAAKVWLNGELVGEHNIGDVGWNVPFKLDVTGKLKPDIENLLAVKVFDISGGGGLWKPVKVMTRR